jgi:hypothetical protein
MGRYFVGIGIMRTSPFAFLVLRNSGGSFDGKRYDSALILLEKLRKVLSNVLTIKVLPWGILRSSRYPTKLRIELSFLISCLKVLMIMASIQYCYYNLIDLV